MNDYRDKRLDGWHWRDVPSVGVGLAHPSDWRCLDGVNGCALVLLAPPGPDEEGPRPTIILTAEVVPDNVDVDAYANRQLPALHRVLTDLRILETVDAHLGELPARRVLATYRQGAFHLTLDQWWGLRRGQAFALAGAVGNSEYQAVAHTVAAIAASVQVRDLRHKGRAE